MTFNSLSYLIFLPIVWLVYSFLPQRFRWQFLLVVSLIFYACLNVPYLLGVIALVTVASYGFGLWIQRVKQPRYKKQLFWGGIATNILILVLMKYLPFLTNNLNLLLSGFGSHITYPHVKLFIAIGVSYYVFQAISYLCDIYLGIEEPETHFGYFALYLSFFPKLLQGPIERASDLIPQFKQRYEFNYENMRFGLLLFAWGLFKKVVLADRLGIYVDKVYDHITIYHGLPVLLATYAYAFQIFFDFSGYTDMALGTARLFNIKLTDNFNKPYLATSIADFWRRWHITFSRWILNYIFKPLQMSWRNWKTLGNAAALLVTFIVSGIWHGASWGFIIWGSLHGLYMACALFYRPYQGKILKAMNLKKSRALKVWQVFITFNLVCFAWIFFRAPNIKGAWRVIGNMVDVVHGWDVLYVKGLVQYLRNNVYITFTEKEFVLIILFLLLYFLLRKLEISDILKKPWYTRWLTYYMLIILISLFHVSNNIFLYYQF